LIVEPSLKQFPNAAIIETLVTKKHNFLFDEKEKTPSP